MSNENIKYETGATSPAVNDLILFTDNTRRTAERRDEIYKKYIQPSKKLKDWYKSMEAEFEKVLCPYAMHQYWVEHGESNSKHIANIGKDGHKEFAALYASDFEHWKSEHGYK